MPHRDLSNKKLGDNAKQIFENWFLNLYWKEQFKLLMKKKLNVPTLSLNEMLLKTTFLKFSYLEKLV